ncbi:MAG: response regulator transcription factor [Streptosporangiaceae bacterium]
MAARTRCAPADRPRSQQPQIAGELGIGEQTVKTHVRGILTKLDLQDRVQAAIFALRLQAAGRPRG